MSKYLDRIVWNSDGLLPVIVQDIFTNKVIMFAWMNKETLKQIKNCRGAELFKSATGTGATGTDK